MRDDDLGEAVRAFLLAELELKKAHDSWDDRNAPRLREELGRARDRMTLLAFRP